MATLTKSVGTIHCAFKVKAEDINDEGEFSGYGSVFDVIDSYKEVVDPGAFRDTLAEHKAKGQSPKMLWQHQSDQPIGVWREMREDKKGLFVRGQLALDEDVRKEVRQAREAHTLLRMGALDGLSIGYSVVEHSFNNEEQVTHLIKLKLREVSPVTFPANEDARISTVKSIRDLEGVLRDAGFSRKEATAIASHGWGAFDQRDAVNEGVDIGSIMGRLESLIKTIRGEDE